MSTSKMAYSTKGIKAVAEACGPRWVSVEDRLPELWYWVYVCKAGELPMCEARLRDDGKWRSSHNALILPYVTHWIEKLTISDIPEAPKD